MIIKLPKIMPKTSISLTEALKRRETKREYLNTELPLAGLSHLLLVGQGLRDQTTKRFAPSAQEQYPLQLYIVANQLEDVNSGLYRYDQSDHHLLEMERGDFSGELGELAIGEQPWVQDAAVVIVIAAHIETMNQHFAAQAPLNQRGERYCYIEVGAVAQNMQLQATALDIGMVLVGGFDNERVKQCLTLPADLVPTALLCLGNI